MNAVYQVGWKELVLSFSSAILISLKNQLQILCHVIVEHMRILLLSGIRHFSSEDHGYL